MMPATAVRAITVMIAVALAGCGTAASSASPNSPASLTTTTLVSSAQSPVHSANKAGPRRVHADGRVAHRSTRSSPSPVMSAAMNALATTSPTPIDTLARTGEARALPAGAFSLPTYGKVNSVPGMLMKNAGILGSRAHGCVWLTDSGGIHAALWPPGYYGRWNPLRIYSRQGRLVWQRGQRYDVGYGFSSVHVDRIKPACRTPGDESYAWWVQPAPYRKSGQ